MTPEKFRQLALALADVVEGSHMGHADFRVGGTAKRAGKVFASLGPGEERGMVKLTADQQSRRVRLEPQVYVPASGTWGRSGYTMVNLRAAKVASVRAAMKDAWSNVAPADQFGGERVRPFRQGTARTSASGVAGNRRGSSNSSPRKSDPR